MLSKRPQGTATRSPSSRDTRDPHTDLYATPEHGHAADPEGQAVKRPRWWEHRASYMAGVGVCNQGCRWGRGRKIQPEDFRIEFETNPKQKDHICHGPGAFNEGLESKWMSLSSSLSASRRAHTRVSRHSRCGGVAHSPPHPPASPKALDELDRFANTSVACIWMHTHARNGPIRQCTHAQCQSWSESGACFELPSPSPRRAIGLDGASGVPATDHDHNTLCKRARERARARARAMARARARGGRRPCVLQRGTR